MRSPLSHLMEEETSGTTGPPGTTRSRVRVESSSMSMDLHAVSRISLQRLYPDPITATAFLAADWGSERDPLTAIDLGTNPTGRRISGWREEGSRFGEC